MFRSQTESPTVVDDVTSRVCKTVREVVRYLQVRGHENVYPKILWFYDSEDLSVISERS